MAGDHLDTARAGEDAACRFFEQQGFKVLARNYRCAFGELDLVVGKGRQICFVEVKSLSAPCGDPEELVDRRKQRKLTQLARYYVQQQRLEDHCFQFDVIAVRSASGPAPLINHYPDAFEAVD